MAIAYDASSGGTALPDTSVTWSHTCTGSDLILVVGISQAGNYEDKVTGVTYNGVAMTRLATDGYVFTSGAYNRAVYLYYLVGPATGAHNIVVSSSESLYFRCVAVSYTGIAQTGQPDGSDSGQVAEGTAITTGVTTTADNCWNVSAIMGYQCSGGTGTTERVETNNYISMGDSNGAKTPAGLYEMTWNSVTQWIGAIQISVKPPTPVGGAVRAGTIRLVGVGHL
jgi:hypothetical protein